MKPPPNQPATEAPEGTATAVSPPPLARELGGRLAGLSLPMQVFVLSVWPLLEQLMAFMVGTIDLMLAARLRPEDLGRDAADALGVAGYIGWLMAMLQGAVGVGASALVARAIGARHRRLASAGLGQSVLLGLAAGCLIGLGIYTLAPWIGWLAGIRGQALELCTLYLRVLAIAQPASAVLFVTMACLRGAGDTRSPFWVMVLVNAVNIGASILFVWGPAPIGGYGVGGIAAGTALAWFVGAALVLGFTASRWSIIRLRAHRLRPHRHTAGRILRVGIPNLVESSGQWIGNFLLLMIVGRLGAYALWPGEGAPGSHMIAIRIESVSFLPGLAIGTAAATLAGQYLGAGNPTRARQAVALCWGTAAVLMSLIGALFLLIPETLTRIISDNPAHLETVPTLLRICGPVQVFFGTYLVLAQALRGVGDTAAAMRLTYFSTFLVRLPLAYVLAIPVGWGLWGLWIGLCFELVVRGVLFALRFLRGNWATTRV
jgi:putative MATE family efflux protein